MAGVAVIVLLEYGIAGGRIRFLPGMLVYTVLPRLLCVSCAESQWDGRFDSITVGGILVNSDTSFLTLNSGPSSSFDYPSLVFVYEPSSMRFWRMMRKRGKKTRLENDRFVTNGPPLCRTSYDRPWNSRERPAPCDPRFLTLQGMSTTTPLVWTIDTCCSLSSTPVVWC